MGRLARLAGALAALALLAGCSTPAASTAAAARPTASTDLAASDAAPTHLTYPNVDVDTDVTPTGLNPDGTIHVPPLDTPAEVNYLNWGPTIRAGRPLVFVSHVNGRNTAGAPVPGGFAHLSHATVGDTVTVTGRSGAQARYHVTDVHTIPKDAFPTSVYQPVPHARLILITCGGQLNHATHSYASNVIVTADIT